MGTTAVDSNHFYQSVVADPLQVASCYWDFSAAQLQATKPRNFNGPQLPPTRLQYQPTFCSSMTVFDHLTQLDFSHGCELLTETPGEMGRQSLVGAGRCAAVPPTNCKKSRKTLPLPLGSSSPRTHHTMMGLESPSIYLVGLDHKPIDESRGIDSVDESVMRCPNLVSIYVNSR